MQTGMVGAGIMGKLLAFALLNAGWDITLFEHSKNNRSMAAAGLLTPIREK
jgi:glycine oxidase